MRCVLHLQHFRGSQELGIPAAHGVLCLLTLCALSGPHPPSPLSPSLTKQVTCSQILVSRSTPGGEPAKTRILTAPRTAFLQTSAGLLA